MSQDKDSKSENAPTSAFQEFHFAGHPWLALQRDMLAIGKRGIQDYSHVRPLQNFTLRERIGCCRYKLRDALLPTIRAEFAIGL